MTDPPPSNRPPARAAPKGVGHIVALLGRNGLLPCTPTAEFDAMVAEAQIELSTVERAQLGLFLAGLLRANEVVNLTAIRDAPAAWIKHIFDAMTLLPVLASVNDDGDRHITIVDIGSGCGVPGIPLAICTPNCHVTLLESTGRKCAFLSAAVDMLSLTNVTVVHQRAEDVGATFKQESGKTSRPEENKHAMRAAFDVAVCRAVGRVAVATELAVPLVRVGGHVLLVKGQAADEELAEARHALNILNATHLGTVDTATGKVVVLKKRGKTPKMYPRRPGDPARNPLARASNTPKPTTQSRTQRDDAE